MSKTLGSILAVSAAIAVNAIPGIGSFISAGVFAATGSATAAILSTYLLTTGLTLYGVSSGISLLGLGPSLPKPDTTEYAIKTSRPPRVSMTGKGRLYGAYALYETAPDGTAIDVYAVHDGVMAEPSFYLGDEAITLTGNTVNEGEDGRYRDGAVKLYWTDGSTPGTANFAAVKSLLPSIWTDNHRGDGVVILALTAAAVKAKLYQETYPQSTVPVPSIVAKWNVYPNPAAADPANEAGWDWTENSLRHLLWYVLKFEGADYATKIAPTLQFWKDAAADCDVAMSLKAGGTEARYRGCIPFKHTDAHKDVKSAIAATFDGWVAPRSDGALVVYSGRYYEPTVSIGPDEIVSYSWDGAGVDDDKAVNEIICSYVSAEHDYNTVECDAWRDEADISRRGQELSQPLEAQVPSHAQARRLAKRKMARAMAPSRGTITTNVAGRIVRGERYINLRIEEAGAVFYDGPAEIVALTRNMSTGGVTFDWIAADPNIDAWDPDTEEGEPAAKGERVAPQALVAPTITDIEVVNGTLSIDVDSPDRADLTWFVRHRDQGAAIWGPVTEYPDEEASSIVTLQTDIIPESKVIEVQVSYMVGDGRVSEWSAPAVVDTTAPPQFNPLNIFFAGDVGAWYDVSDLSSMFQDTAGTIPAAVDSPVARINDKSGRGNHILQATAASQPILRRANGLYWLEFDGTNDSMLAAFAMPQPWDRISAIRQVSWTSSDRVYGNAGAAGVAALTQFSASPQIAVYDGAGTPVGTTDAAIGVDAVVTERHNGASSRIAVNNGAYVTGSAGTTAADGICIAAQNGASNFGHIRFYGLVAIDRALSDAEITALRGHFAGKAGVTL